MLRIPKELHKQLIEAAKENGVSLNQYALYKLAKKQQNLNHFGSDLLHFGSD